MVDSKQSRDGESVLARWSRRKAEAAQEHQPGKDIEAAAAPVEVSADPAGAEKPLTDADMPDLDSLTAESDFTPFMSSGVSDELRKLALRKLFRAPLFNIRDGLDEYDEDFTTFEKLGDIVTADMKHRLEMEQKKLRELAQEEEGDGADTLQSVETADDEDDAETEIAGEDDRQQPAAPEAVQVARKTDVDHE